MSKPHLVVSTCGTSVLTNQVEPALRSAISRFANSRSPDAVPKEVRDQLLRHIDSRRGTLAAEGKPDVLMALSAELNGLIRYYGGNLGGRADRQVLVCTDTWLGEATARILEDVLSSFGHSVEVLRIPDLRTDDLNSFTMGVSELVRWCAETARGYRESGHHVVFNLTGGFKSVQGIMQVLAMIYADESVYVFESGSELLTIPRIPIRIEAVRAVRERLVAFRRMAVGLTVSAAEFDDAPQSLVTIDDGLATLSPWGELVWDEAYRSIYREGLQEPATQKLRFQAAFREEAGRLSPDRLVLINQRLDQLARHLESGRTYNPRSLDFKKLAAPKGASTHECDAWSDRDAKRLFGHFESDVFAIDDLSAGLH